MSFAAQASLLLVGARRSIQTPGFHLCLEGFIILRVLVYVLERLVLISVKFCKPRRLGTPSAYVCYLHFLSWLLLLWSFWAVVKCATRWNVSCVSAFLSQFLPRAASCTHLLNNPVATLCFSGFAVIIWARRCSCLQTLPSFSNFCGRKLWSFSRLRLAVSKPLSQSRDLADMRISFFVLIPSKLRSIIVSPVVLTWQHLTDVF